MTRGLNNADSKAECLRIMVFPRFASTSAIVAGRIRKPNVTALPRNAQGKCRLCFCGLPSPIGAAAIGRRTRLWCNRIALFTVIEEKSGAARALFMNSYRHSTSARFLSLCAKALMCVAILLVLVGRSAAKNRRDGENRYETVNQTLAPIIAVLTRNGSAGNHSLNLETSVIDTASPAPDATPMHLRIAYEFPDKLLVQFPAFGSSAVVCRNGQTVWAYPAAIFIPLVERIDPPLSTQPLPPMEIDAQKAVFLPALLDVRDAGTARLADRDCRVFDVRPIAVTKQQQQAKEWPGRLWIDPEHHRLVQLALRFSNWSVMLQIDKVELAPALAPETWNPTAEQHDQVAAIPGEKIFTLIQLALAQKK